MKRFFALLLIAAIIMGIIIFFTNPSLLDNVWLWLIGFAGSIIGFFRNIFDQLKDVFKDRIPPKASEPIATSDVSSQIQTSEKKLESLKNEIEKQETVLKNTTPFLGTTVTLIRFTHDKDTTLGLLYVNGKFMAYTLEDTYQEVKVPKKTRIPSGTYDIGFRENTDPPSKLTQKYRDRADVKAFFTHHLEIKDIENFDKVYIHIGNDHGDTDGCILIADGLYASSLVKKIQNSIKAYTLFYKRIQALLEGGERVRIIIHDEDWIEKSNVNSINT